MCSLSKFALKYTIPYGAYVSQGFSLFGDRVIAVGTERRSQRGPYGTDQSSFRVDLPDTIVSAVVLFTLLGIYEGVIIIIIIIIGQPLCPVIGRRPQHAVSKLACLVQSSARSCRSSMCQGRLSTAWQVSLVVFYCHVVSKW